MFVMLRGLNSKMIRRFFPRYIPASDRPEKKLKYPELRPSDVENARLFASRESLILFIASELRGGSIAEVGVMYGDFSAALLCGP